MSATGLPLALLALAIYESAAFPDLGGGMVLLVVLGVLMLSRAPRGLCYAAAVLALALILHGWVLGIATGGHDPGSDRDDAVEIAARAFRAGENPWHVPTHLGNTITTGAASILVALPSMMLFDRINELTFVFWLALIVFLLWGDLRTRNDSFLPLAIIIAIGLAGIQHALWYSQEELYFGFAGLALGWALIERRWYLPAGLGLAYALGTRSSYAFLIAGLLVWFGQTHGWRVGPFVWIAAGTAVGVALIIAPFAWVGGEAFWGRNFHVIASVTITGTWPDMNPLFVAGNALLELANSPAQVRWIKVALALAILSCTWWQLARLRLPHPFGHVLAASFVANLLVYSPQFKSDYLLFLTVPALMAWAWTPRPIRRIENGRESRPDSRSLTEQPVTRSW